MGQKLKRKMGIYGISQAIAQFQIGVFAFLQIGMDYKGGNQIMIVITQEVILLAIGLFLVHLSVGLDDLVGGNQTLYLLPLAGAESAQALGQLVAYYPIRGTITFHN